MDRLAGIVRCQWRAYWRRFWRARHPTVGHQGITLIITVLIFQVSSAFRLSQYSDCSGRHHARPVAVSRDLPVLAIPSNQHHSHRRFF